MAELKRKATVDVNTKRNKLIRQELQNLKRNFTNP